MVLGKTNEKVSKYCLGTMFFGTKVDEQTSFKLLDIYYEAGGRFIDTANKYASWIPGFIGGESETVIGKWMRARGNRKNLFLTSKVGFAYQEVPRSLNPKYIISECEKSLKRLGVETIDLYFAHNYDKNTPFEESLEAFHKIQKDGKVRHPGASNYFSWHLEKAKQIHTARDWEPFCCLQQRYTLLQPTVGAYFGTQMVLTPDLIDYCKEHHITIMGYSPLLGGAYSAKGKDIPEQFKNNDNLKRFATLQDIASETGFSLNQVVLAWMVQQNPSVIPLITGSKEQQLFENIGAANLILEAGQMKRLNNEPGQEIKYV